VDELREHVVLGEHGAREEQLGPERPVRVDAERHATEAAVLDVEPRQGQVVGVRVPGQRRADGGDQQDDDDGAEDRGEQGPPGVEVLGRAGCAWRNRAPAALPQQCCDHGGDHRAESPAVEGADRRQQEEHRDPERDAETQAGQGDEPAEPAHGWQGALDQRARKPEDEGEGAEREGVLENVKHAASLL
jgi:hypothetical protein